MFVLKRLSRRHDTVLLHILFVYVVFAVIYELDLRILGVIRTHQYLFYLVILFLFKIILLKSAATYSCISSMSWYIRFASVSITGHGDVREDPSSPLTTSVLFSVFSEGRFDK